MKIPSLTSCALCVCGVAVAACSQTTQLSRLQYIPIVNSLPHRGAHPLSYRVLYNFGALPDGESPRSDLIGRGGQGIFYGTTQIGGAHRRGTVFSITTNGTERVLYSFTGECCYGGPDGSEPLAGLIDVGGTLYGTTQYGGLHGKGAVFTITTSGKEAVLHSFSNGSSGRHPVAGLIDVGGTLYGTTQWGGSLSCGNIFRGHITGCGTVFSITTTGVVKVLHAFGNGSDGIEPFAKLVAVGRTLYGTTYLGGAYGKGTVFSIATDGTEKVLYSFHGIAGSYPAAGLINVAGTLYGTTSYGAKYYSGTVFSITTRGEMKVLHVFGNGTDGSEPFAGLIDVSGTLYGTTADGGAYGSGTYPSGGTVFSITTGGVEKVLHSFGNGNDGKNPAADLNYRGGSLIGTTYQGGTYGFGTVFALRP